RGGQAGAPLPSAAPPAGAPALGRALLRRRPREVDAAEDVAEEPLLSIHRDRHTYDPERSFRPWMYAIAKHRLLDFVAKRRRRSENEVLGDERWEDARSEAVAEPTGPTPLLHPRLALLPPQQHLLVQRDLAVLPQKQRETISRLKAEGWSVAEIAAKTGLSEGAVKVTAHRGYQKIRKLIVRPAHDE